MNRIEYLDLLRNSSVKLAIPIIALQYALELTVDKAMSEQNPYLRGFYLANAQTLLHSMVAQVPEIETYFKEQQNPLVTALLEVNLQPYEVVK
ncbi:hypothetical protein [Gloeothece verrucosa]|uniref:Uncharacterized protein n=1 Tax=Gloeothece verrucosa (strain PCC 7822) TaxID=497965 RepID=E0U7U0_GLOV7|nr:hypothetical protein [Gloeothece verrucosa]ADN14582.1 hypothetical protein Cyan7822_2611 [Gloeothece verrucosa PCC 7822]ADN14902.1 hypothetical protein Cyan7822_2945 [Gloeothece verrucosa PCC 7822]ADN15217.1 hypothetical protein Cyan7822_3267 [Gloeothece verrucosa PCC 7822]ADN16434.1 hypothetical protein Cyan7822_4524 [Gloeothece verrucosa PCC 7822]